MSNITISATSIEYCITDAAPAVTKTINTSPIAYDTEDSAFEESIAKPANKPIFYSCCFALGIGEPNIRFFIFIYIYSCFCKNSLSFLANLSVPFFVAADIV